MRIRRAVAVEPDKAATPSAVRRLLDAISTEELEPIAVEVIREHRRRLQRAQESFDALEGGDKKGATAAEPHLLRQNYRLALLSLHGQHHLVSLILAALGYVPDVVSQSRDDSAAH